MRTRPDTNDWNEKYKKMNLVMTVVLAGQLVLDLGYFVPKN